MKIILSVNTYFSFQKHRRSLALRLCEEGHDVRVIIPLEEATQVHRDVPYSYTFVPMSRKGTNLIDELKTIFAFCELYLNERPDVVHHFTIKPVIYGSLASLWANVPKTINSITGLGYVYSAETAHAQGLKRIINFLYRQIFKRTGATIIFQNPDDQRQFIDDKLIRPDQGHLIPGSGVDTEKFSPSERRPHQRIKFYFISRMIWSKGVGELICASRNLKKKGHEFELHFVGHPDSGSPDGVSLKDLESWNREGVIIYHGYQDDVLAFLEDSDVVILPTKYREGIPMSLLEAMACGKPIITTDTPGAREVVQGNGILIRPGDTSDLEKAMVECLQESSNLAEWGRKSRQLALDKFSKDTVLKMMYSIYTKN